VPSSRTNQSLFSPLTVRNYRYLYVGQAVSGLGNGMFVVALAWTVYGLTGSAADMGAVLIADIVPQLALVTYAGVLADRISRRLVILFSNVGAGLVTLILSLALAAHKLDAAGLIVCSFLLGGATAFFGPAFNAIFKNVLKPTELRAGNSLRSITNSINRLVGPTLGGVIYAFGGGILAFGIDAVTFFFAALTVAFVIVPESPVGRSGGAISDARDGFKYVFSTPWLLSITLIALVANTVCIAPMEVLLGMVVRESHAGSLFLGAVLSTQASFAVIGATLVGKFGSRIQPTVAFYVLVVIMACGVLAIGLHMGDWTVLLGASLIGVGFTFGSVEDTVLQRYVPDEYLGRVYGVGVMAAFSLFPIGYAIAGFWATSVGPFHVLMASGAIGIFASIICYRVIGLRSRSEMTQQVL